MGVTHRVRQRHGLAESMAQLRLGARAPEPKVMGTFLGVGQFQDGAAGIDFAAILAQARRVQFDGDIIRFDSIEEPAVERGAILPGVDVGSFWQIRRGRLASTARIASTN